MWQMRTTLDLDDELIAALLARYPGASKTEAIERAVRSYLLSDAATRLRELGGTMEIEDRSGELRTSDRHA